MKVRRIQLIPLGFFILFLYTVELFAQVSFPPRGAHEEQLAQFGQTIPDYPELPPGVAIAELAERKYLPSRYVVGYHPYWNGTTYLRYVWNLLTVVNYFSVGINSDGTIGANRGWPPNDLINRAHTNGVRVQLVVTNFSEQSIGTLLGSATYRTNAVNNLVDLLFDAGGNAIGDGIDIDFERVPGSRRSQLVLFMQELKNALTARGGSGMSVSMATPAVDWSNAWDYDALADICDWLFVMGYNYYWRGSDTSGPVAPLAADSQYNYYITKTINDYLTKTGNDTSKIILGLPYYGIKWPTTNGNAFSNTRGDGSSIFYNDAKPEAASFGRNWHDNSKSPWYSYYSNGWYVGWFDDEESLAHKYFLAENEGLKGVGMWALGYDDGYNQLWQLLYNHFGATTPPLIPKKLRVTSNSQAGEITVNVRADSGATSFDFWVSTDGENFRLQENSISPNITMTGVSIDSIYYFKVNAKNAFGISEETEILATAIGTEQAKVLVVNGFDRESGVSPENSHDYIRQHGQSIKAAGYGFNSASNEAVETGAIRLLDYEIVDWILGEEATETNSLTTWEQDRLKKFLQFGGKLLISGSEIGYDLVEEGNALDLEFFTDYLKSIYVKDAAGGHQGVYQMEPEGSSQLFNGLGSIDFDDGTHGTYDVDWPDGILPDYSAGAELVMKYVGVSYPSNGGAGTAYTGVFGEGTIMGGLVYLSVPFETIVVSAVRDSVMRRVLEYFEAIPSEVTEEPKRPILPESYTLFQNYPNPFNSTTHIEFTLTESRHTTLTIYNILGRTVNNLVDSHLEAGEYRFEWDGKGDGGEELSSGIYFYVLRSGDFIARRKMTLLK